MSDFDYSQFEETPPPPSQKNRMFMVIAGVLGVVILLAIVATAVFAFFVLPGQNAQKAEIAIRLNAQNTATVMAATSSALTAMAPTFTPIPPTETATPEPTFTPMPTKEEPTATPELGTGGGLTEDMAMTATVSALLTQAAGGKPEVPAAEVGATVVATALPTTGFADSMGIPGLVGLGVLFVALILITRQVRSVRTH